MTAYFGWRVASVCCFSNAELSYLQVLFELPLPSLIRDYQQARLQVEVDEGDDYYVYDPIGEDGRRIFLDGRPEERNYTPVERQQFLLELQGVGRSETLSSRLLNEISLYTLRRSEGYVESRALDISKVGSLLAPYILDYCRVTERPFPRRAIDDVSIPPMQWEDTESKLTPWVGDQLGGANQTQQEHPSWESFRLFAESKLSAREDLQQQQKTLFRY